MTGKGWKDPLENLVYLINLESVSNFVYCCVVLETFCRTNVYGRRLSVMIRCHP